jgi:hypothetical protein
MSRVPYLRSEDARAMSGITLLLNTLDEVGADRVESTNLASQLEDTTNGQKSRILSIILTSGDKDSNKKLIDALKELDLELHEEFPHQDTIEYLKHQVLACYYDAVGAHNRKIEEMRQNTINRSLGAHTVLDETKLFSRLMHKYNNRKQRKQLKFKEDEYIDEDDDYIEYDESEEFE